MPILQKTNPCSGAEQEADGTARLCSTTESADHSDLPLLSETVHGETLDQDASRPATEWEILLVKYGKSQWEEAVSNVKEMLQRFVTITTGFIGGGFVLAKAEAFSLPISVVVISLFLCSLAASLYGLWPRESTVNVFCSSEVEAFRERSLSRKQSMLAVTTIFFFTAVIIALIGIIFK